MNFDVVIATYNRPHSLKRLVEDILKCNLIPTNIIIVDSSNDDNTEIQNKDKVVYVKSKIGNQPYQRYLGYLNSTADCLVFLDDDMEVLSDDWLNLVSREMQDTKLSGLALNFVNDNDFLEHKVPKSKLLSNTSFGNLARCITGSPALKPGKFWLCGLRGKQPQDESYTEWFSGGAFVVRKEQLYKNFNFKLFDLFDQSLGMGEDVILAFTLSRIGKIKYIDEKLFYHNDQKDSTYTLDLKQYATKVTFSRLYLSYEFMRLTNGALFKAYMHFNWYTFCRLAGLLLNQLTNYKKSRNMVVKGTFKGWMLALKRSSELKFIKSSVNEK